MLSNCDYPATLTMLTSIYPNKRLLLIAMSFRHTRAQETPMAKWDRSKRTLTHIHGTKVLLQKHLWLNCNEFMIWKEIFMCNLHSYLKSYLIISWQSSLIKKQKPPNLKSHPLKLNTLNTDRQLCMSQPNCWKSLFSGLLQIHLSSKLGP